MDYPIQKLLPLADFETRFTSVLRHEQVVCAKPALYPALDYPTWLMRLGGFTIVFVAVQS
jgi:hypothetical protein